MLVLVYSVQCCPWSEFSDIMHDTVQALWYNGTCAQSALDTHATHRRAFYNPNKGQGGQTHLNSDKMDMMDMMMACCELRLDYEIIIG